MRLLIATLAAAVLTLPATAAPRERPSPEAKVSKALAGRTPAKPQSCIRLRPGLSSQTIGNAIIYEDSARRWYVNRPDGGRCTELNDDVIVVTRTPSNQLCRGDIVQLIDRTARFPRGSCGLDDFVPYERAKTPKR